MLFLSFQHFVPSAASFFSIGIHSRSSLCCPLFAFFFLYDLAGILGPAFLFQIWFHTRFMECEPGMRVATLEIPKGGIDKACKDTKHNIYDPTLSIRIQLMEHS
jgi:hypothetical protein